jgi:hypothetical protein
MLRWCNKPLVKQPYVTLGYRVNALAVRPDRGGGFRTGALPQVRLVSHGVQGITTDSTAVLGHAYHRLSSVNIVHELERIHTAPVNARGESFVCAGEVARE